jgi:hypothetical protein
VFKNDSGKLMVYASTEESPNQRLYSVKVATEKAAEQMNLNFELVRQTRGRSQIYVYYENGEDEPIPIYCDEGKSDDLTEISSKIRNVMYVLSFHPRHSALKQVRSSIMKLS